MCSYTIKYLRHIRINCAGCVLSYHSIASALDCDH